MGLDNGDSTDYDSYQGSCRKLFNGKMLAIIKCTGDPDTIRVDVSPAENVPVRKIELGTSDGSARTLDKEHNKIAVIAKVLPEDATDKEITFRALNLNGTDTNIAKITQNGDTCEIEAIGDGEFILR